MKNFKMKLHGIKRFVLSAVFPNQCPFCNKTIDYNMYYCEKCVAELNKLSEIDNIITIKGIEKYVAVCYYDEKSKPVIRKAKEQNNGYAMWAIGKMIYDKLILDNILQNVDVILPVPMHRKDKAKRGYNQAVLIAKEIGTLANKPVLKNQLKKTVKTHHQKGLTAQKRRENLIGSYSAKSRNKFHWKSVLIVDDVCTTGSTLECVADILRKNGAAEIYAATFAKTQLQKQE